MKNLHTLKETSEALNIPYKDVILLGSEGVIEVYEHNRDVFYNYDSLEFAIDYCNNNAAVDYDPNQSLSGFRISVRTMNCLKSMKIETLRDLANEKRYSLLKIKGFGQKSLLEVENLLHKFNLYLK